MKCKKPLPFWMFYVAVAWNKNAHNACSHQTRRNVRLLSRWQRTINYKWIACEAFDYVLSVIITSVISSRRHFIDNNHHRKNHKWCFNANLIYRRAAHWVANHGHWHVLDERTNERTSTTKIFQHGVFRLSFDFSLVYVSFVLVLTMVMLTTAHFVSIDLSC